MGHSMKRKEDPRFIRGQGVITSYSIHYTKLYDGLNAMFVPEAYGGAQLSYACYLACVREIAQACASTGIIWATTFHAMKPVIDFGAEEQKKRLLPRIAKGGLGALAITEPGAGSDATGMKTRFTPKGDDIAVDGGKTFITNGDVADLFLLFGNRITSYNVCYTKLLRIEARAK